MWRRSGNPQPAAGCFQKSALGLAHERSSGHIRVDLLQFGGILTNPVQKRVRRKVRLPAHLWPGHTLKMVVMRTNDDSAPPESKVEGKIVLIHVGMSLRQAEELLIGATLQQTAGNVREAAKILGIDRSTLHER